MSDKLSVSSYQSGAASLFAVMAREEPTSPPAPLLRREGSQIVITCQRCLSDDTEMVDHEHDIYQCRNCGETFIRASG